MRNALLIVACLPLFAFGQVDLDSLWGIWNDESQPDTIKLKAMKRISWDGYVFSKPDTAYQYAQLQYEYAKKKNLKQFMADALNTQGVSFAVKGLGDSAIFYWEKCITIYKSIDDKKGIAASIGNIGIVYKNRGEQQKALDNYKRSLSIFKELNDKMGMAKDLNNIGLIYKDQGDHDNAIKNYHKSLKLYEELGDEKEMGVSYNNIGIILYTQQDYEKALEYFEKSIAIAQKFGNKRNEAQPTSNMALLYRDQKKLTEALETFRVCLDLYREIGDNRGVGIAWTNIGLIYKDQGEYEKALESLNESLKVTKEGGYKEWISINLRGIGDVYTAQKKYNLAIEYLQKAMEVAKESGVLDRIVQASKSLWTVYKTVGNHQKALEMHEQYIQMRDSIQSEKNQRTTIQLEYQHAYELKAAEDSVVHAKEQEIKQAEIDKQQAELKVKQNQQYALFGGIALVLVFSGFMYNRYKVTQKQKQVIEEQKKKVEKAHEEIRDSINYAKRIQKAILPADKLVKELLPDSFVLYQPKDVVAGDFYWLEKVENKILFAAADCTGHGVPGAMVSVVCHNAMNRAVKEFNLTDPGKILDKTRSIVLEELSKSDEEVKDGMDIALCTIDGDNLAYAGAHNPLWIIRDGELIEIKANRQPIGNTLNPQPFTTHKQALKIGDVVYAFSDGYSDQFGGANDKRMGSKRMKEFILSIHQKPLNEQKELLQENLIAWMNESNAEQLDDVCVIGIKI